MRHKAEDGKQGCCEYTFISFIAKATWRSYKGGIILKSGTHWPMESCSHVVLKQAEGVATDLRPQLNKYPVFPCVRAVSLRSCTQILYMSLLFNVILKLCGLFEGLNERF